MISESTKSEIRNTKNYNLEDRCLKFAISCRNFINQLDKTIVNREYLRQLIRSSASIGANYIEANESLGQKDFLMRIKISRKEAKETCYWLTLLETESNSELYKTQISLKQEATELMMIFSSIMRKFQ